MKKSILLMVAAISFSFTQAQVSFGVKAGLNLANATGSDASGSSIRTSFHAGALAQIPLAGMISFQPELMYSDQGAKSSQDNGSGGTLSVAEKLGYINLPLLLKYSTAAGVFVETGPQVGFLMSANASASGISENEKKYFNSTDVSWAFGLGYLSSMNIGIDVRYNLGLTNIENKDNSGGTGTIKNSVIQIGLFYMFGHSGKK